MNHSPEFQAVVAAFRQVLKSRKITYEELATRLGSSAQTVKRLVNGYGDVSLEKLVAACRALDVEFFDLVKLAGEPKERTFELTVEQEEWFVAHPHHHAVFNLLRKPKPMSEIKEEHGLSEKCARRYLRELEAAGFLDRLEGDRCKLRFEGGHNWLAHGPLYQRFFAESLQRLIGFFSNQQPPKGTERMHTWSSTQLSMEAVKDLMHEVTELGGRFRRRAQREQATLPKAAMLDVELCFLVAAPFRAMEDPRPIELEM